MVTSKHIEELIEKLQSAKTWQEKRNILIMLEPPEVSDPMVIQPLVDAVIDIAKKGEHRILRRTAVNLLGEIGGAEVVEPLIVVLLKSPTPDVRRAAAKALGKIGDAKAVKPLTWVLEDENEDQYVREEVVEALGKIASKEAIKSLITVLDTSVGGKASLVLKQIGEPALVSLISALDSESQTIRERVVTILGEIGDKKAVQPLIAILEDKDEDYERRGKAAEALGKIRDASAVEPLINAACHDAEHAVRCWSVMALGDIGDARAVEPLVRLLHDKSHPWMMRMRGLAAEALGKIGDNRAVMPLVEVLGDQEEEWWVKDNAVWALGELGDPRAEVVLLTVLRAKLQADDDAGLKKVLVALDKLGFLDRQTHSQH